MWLERSLTVSAYACLLALTLTAATLTTATLTATAASADVVGFRMDGDGKYPDATPPVKWSPTENVAFKTEMPSWSNASPVLLDEKSMLVVLSEPDEILAVHTENGKILWRDSVGDVAPERPKAHDANGWTSATPVSDGEHVFTLFGSGVAAAHTVAGERVWAKSVREPEHRWGNSASPVLGGGHLILHVVDLIALDPKTGEEAWRAESEPGWGSPVVTTIDGTEVVITPSGDVFQAADGAKVASEIGRLQYATPVIEDGVVYFIEKKATAVRLPAKLDGKFEQLWQSRVEGSRHYASSVVHDGLIYAISREQEFSILNAESGEVLDARKLELDDQSNGAYTSITLAGDKLYLATENGAMAVFEPGRSYREIARNQVEGLRSSPVFDGDRMYVRAFEYLYAFTSAAPAPKAAASAR